MNPLVSIIMPTYQGTDNIVMALKGALRQTYRPIEIIVVDDNGENSKCQLETEKLLEEYIQNGQITYIKHKNNINGSAARNTGMKNSKGEYIAFLDDDDYMLEDKIEKQVREFEKLDLSYGLVYCSGYIVKENGIGYALSIVEDDTLFNLLSGKLRFNSTMMMIRRDVYIQTGGFDESYRRHQDWEFCCRLLSKYKAKAVPEHLVYKYVVDRNVPSDPDKAVQLRLYFLDKNKEIIEGFCRKKKKQIISFHYRDLAINYGLAHKVKETVKWLFKAGNPVIQGIFMFKYILKRKTVHREKYAPSLEETRK